MKTEILSSKELLRAATFLKEGEIVAFPTETVYGLGAPLFSPTTIEKIFQAKNRPADNPLIAHVNSLEQCGEIGWDFPSTFYQLAETFFPGPLTLIVKKKKEVPLIATGGLETVAIRMPSHPLALALIEAVGEPLVAPSANLSGKPSATSAVHVLEDFSGKIRAVIEGGCCQHGIESTVIDLVSFSKPTLMRTGAIPRQEIEKVLDFPLEQYTKGAKSSPGMKYRHYAPNVPVYVFTERRSLEIHLSNQLPRLILSSEPLPIPHLPLQAKTLYHDLRLADREGYDEVVVYCPECPDEAVAHRLEKISDALESSFKTVSDSK